MAAGIVSGISVSALLYELEIVSWSAPSAAAPIALAAVGLGLSLAIVLVLLLRSRKSRTRAGVFVSALALGVASGVVAPGILGETAAWDQPFESAAYRLDVTEVAIPNDIIEALRNPLDGERSTLNYIAPLSSGGTVMVSSPGTEIFDFEDQEGMSALDPQAILSWWDSEGTVLKTVNLTTLFPSIHLVRGIHLEETTGDLYLTALPLQEECRSLQLWRVGIDLSTFELGQAKELFRTTPCLDSASGYQQFGGRVVSDGTGRILVSVGDFGYGVSTTREEAADGPYQERPDILTPPSTYGVVVAVESSGAATVVSRGHRNPQGLAFDAETRTLYLSEHGPKGGDEINVIRQGADYGWPDVTYGGPYGGDPQPDESWSLGRWFGSNHGSFEEPLMSWLPAIAASELVVYRGEEFPAWQGDVLLASFKGNIHRLRLVNGRVVVDERIEIRTRPRDLAVSPDGTLWVATDDNRLLNISAAR